MSALAPGPVSKPAKPGGVELHVIAARIELVVFDVDGVLTDGGLYYGSAGESLKRFHVRDGHGIVMSRLSGLPCAVLTARYSKILEARGRELQLAAIYQGRKNKGKALLEMTRRLGVEPSACAYMGDDLNDLAAMALAGLPACPADAAHEVRQQALFISRNNGGHGAARELLELVLKATDRWDRVLDMMRTGNIVKK